MKKSMLILLGLIVALTLVALPLINSLALDDKPEPIDPQSWVLQRDQTWDDFKPNPIVDWDTFDMSKTRTRTIRGLVILVDFPDRPFHITEAPGTDLVGNPQFGPIAKENVAKYYLDYLNNPAAKDQNHGATITGFWREASFGKWDITLDACGPFTMSGFEIQYGFSYGTTVSTSNPLGDIPPGLTRYSSSNYTSQAVNLAVSNGINMANYDFCFILHAGYDESGVWQEFGEMMFETKDDVSYEFGALARINKIQSMGYTLPQTTIDWAKLRDSAGKNWARSRYGPDPWTSWYGEIGIWSFASSTTAGGRSIRVSVQGESDGMGIFAHEFGHISSLGDNYNDPFAVPSQRSYSAPWDTMGTGKIGPGGNHSRWMIPSGQGGSVPIHHMLRSKLSTYLGFVSSGEIVDININNLRNGTPVVAEVAARNYPTGSLFGLEKPKGLRINNMTEQKPVITRQEDWRSETYSTAARAWNGYCLEVVDRSGYDSFACDSGVLLSKYKTAETAPHTWVIDSHPEEMAITDYISPEGNRKRISQGDMLQLADATFHAGISSVDTGYYAGGMFKGDKTESEEIISGDTVNEYFDPWNGLHFYILDKITTPGAYGDILTYKVAVRAADATLGTTPPKAGLAVAGNLEIISRIVEAESSNRVAVVEFDITNTGAVATDIIRVTPWGDLETSILNNLYAIAPGETVTVPVYLSIAKGTTMASLAGQNIGINVASETNAANKNSCTVAAQSLYKPLIISVANVSAKPGDEVSVTYKISGNQSGFSALDLKIPYDNTIYTPIAVTAAGAMNTPFFVFNPLYAANLMRVAFAADDNLAGDGVLFSVTYKVAAGAPGVGDYPLGLEVVKMQYFSVMDKPIDLEATVDPGALVIGILGDVNGDGFVSPEDAMLILQMLVGLVDWTPRALLLGDINGDGIVDTSDAALILRMVVGG